MSTFQFKRFSVVNEKSSMKVNTDGVLLGAAVSIRKEFGKILDIGTGTGTIALMVAQRMNEISDSFSISGIDIDSPSAEECSINFSASPWSSHLTCMHTSLSEYAKEMGEELMDLIVSNPPYFDNSLTAPEQRRNAARHTGVSAEDGMSLGPEDVLRFASEHLSDSGIVAMVLPHDILQSLCRYGRSYGLYLYRIIRVRTTEKKNPKRMIVEFIKGRVEKPIEELLTLMQEGKRTEQYISLTRDFYL